MENVRKIYCLTIFLVLSCVGQVSAQASEIDRHNVYGHKDGMAMYYDVEVPSSPNGLGVVFVVSGGFLSGADNLNIARPFWEVLLEHGYTLFQIYHPGMPTFRIPDAVEALRIGIQHIKDNSESFGVDPERLGILGISSGGHLALQLSMEIEPVKRTDSDFKAAIAIMPITDLGTIPPEAELFGARLLDFDPEVIPVLSPVNHVTPDDPPILIVHGTRDQAVNFEANSVKLAAMLKEAGVESKLLALDAGHEVFSDQLMSETHAAMLDWLQKHL